MLLVMTTYKNNCIELPEQLETATDSLSLDRTNHPRDSFGLSG